jgi:hypothetical protein
MRALLVVLASIGCGSAPAGPVAAPQVSNKTAQPLALRPFRATSDDLALLPIDSEVVIGINVHKLVGSTIWKQWLAPKASQVIVEMRNACGYDALDTLTSIALGMKGSAGNVTGVAVARGLPRDKTMACLPAIQQLVVKSGGTATRDGDAIITTDKDGKTAVYTFIDASTLLMVMGADASKQALDAAARGSNGLVNSPAFLDMYHQIRTSDSMWLLMSGNSPAMAKVHSLGVSPKGLFGSIDVSDKIVLAIALRLASADEAHAIAKQFQQQLNSPSVQALFDRLEITADQVDVDVAIELGDAKLRQMIAMMGAMMGTVLGP